MIVHGLWEGFRTVIPAQAGIHPTARPRWIPACAGMTFLVALHTDFEELV